jgi:hypothetical protein
LWASRVNQRTVFSVCRLSACPHAVSLRVRMPSLRVHNSVNESSSVVGPCPVNKNFSFQNTRGGGKFSTITTVLSQDRCNVLDWNWADCGDHVPSGTCSNIWGSMYTDLLSRRRRDEPTLEWPTVTRDLCWAHPHLSTQLSSRSSQHLPFSLYLISYSLWHSSSTAMQLPELHALLFVATVAPGVLAVSVFASCCALVSCLLRDKPLVHCMHYFVHPSALWELQLKNSQKFNFKCN